MKRVTVTCPCCKKHIQAYYKENRWVEWIEINCDWCGYKRLLKEDEIDCIQPDSNLWDLVYGNNIFKETEKNKKKKKWEEEKRKEGLDAKYNREFKRPWERKFVKDKVLEEK